MIFLYNFFYESLYPHHHYLACLASRILVRNVFIHALLFQIISAVVNESTIYRGLQARSTQTAESWF